MVKRLTKVKQEETESGRRGHIQGFLDIRQGPPGGALEVAGARPGMQLAQKAAGRSLRTF